MDDPTGHEGVRLERRGAGWAAHGPGFYAWDVDARALLDTACELASRVRPEEPRHGGGIGRRALRRLRGAPPR
ncbi:MAG: hypothetical protein DCC71_17375 [Proteobacteria bacterium]|nr:MAG: hypothetical protein DCC71_17375 [Pseudomonadota bacterium]